MKKIIFGILVLAIAGIGYFSFKEKPSENNTKEDYKILQKWDLPEVLNEISGIAWIDEYRVACVQDEDGIIFIYNLNTSEVEGKTSFGDGGDYEGIAVVKNNAYVLRSDGVLFEVDNFTGDKPQVQKHVTETNKFSKINLEGLCADSKNNRLLLAVKEGKDFEEQKGVYTFNLNNKDSDKAPLFMLRLSDPVFKSVKAELKEKFSPGEIGIHPKTGEYYILDGTRPKLLITDKDGVPKELFMFRSKDFGNPEGLTFSPNGDLYISNEAEDAPANILKISLNRKK
ncbi:SdiA-regulated domain-containing protein [Salinimicrobium tongyeongense]|uniref:SdiA-regulated domain-containing protein n=1 Tax=Salinimicrobium tongyeongense TaxID=2809707 RepID=A0ABY6NTI2_9FLAO|nr:SdiA-regulated domain-containing protein [Salinimicrobium tongyeongense]UZH56079.1 SdiA-regulated domain-containing protein [Salinimicrobium tongyeongense]